MKAILLRLPEELVAQIDALRGDVPRTVFIRRCIEQNAERVNAGKIDEIERVAIMNEARGGKGETSLALRLHSLDRGFGPVKPKPGSRLKKR